MTCKLIIHNVSPTSIHPPSPGIALSYRSVSSAVGGHCDNFGGGGAGGGGERSSSYENKMVAQVGALSDRSGLMIPTGDLRRCQSDGDTASAPSPVYPGSLFYPQYGVQTICLVGDIELHDLARMFRP